MIVSRLLLVAGSALSVFISSSASAYCRTHTDDPPASSCPESCKEEGLPLYWAKSNLTYAFNERGFPYLEDDELRDLIATSFDAWEQVTCNGTSVGLRFIATEEPTPLQEGPRQSEPNANVVAHLSEDEWRARRYDAQAYAITAVWFSPRNGEIMGADMLFNGRMGRFGECSESGCGRDDPATDLRNVATHEIGHFLGLSHSDVSSSTMWCGAAPREVSKRTLTADDIEGLCAIYPPGDAFRKDQAVLRAGGGPTCAASPGGARDWAALLGLLLPGWVLGRRRFARRGA